MSGNKRFATDYLLYHILFAILFRIIDKNGGKPPLTYRQFQSILATLESPPHPEPTLSLEFIHISFTPIKEDHDEKYGVPSLEELGWVTKSCIDD